MAKVPAPKKPAAKPVEDETDLEEDDGIGPKGDPGSDDLSAPVDEALDPEAERELRAFYKANPDAMRKWVDTDATAFAEFMPAEPEEEVGETDELIEEVEEGAKERDDEEEPVENAFCPTGKGGGVDPTCSPGEIGVVKLKDGRTAKVYVDSETSSDEDGGRRTYRYKLSVKLDDGVKAATGDLDVFSGRGSEQRGFTAHLHPDTHPKFRRQGIASQLYEHAAVLAARHGGVIQATEGLSDSAYGVWDKMEEQGVSRGWKIDKRGAV